MRILITGVSGMLGSTLAVELSKNHKVFGTGNSDMFLPIDYKIFDLSNESFEELIDWSKPELIIHCAAVTNGNQCQNSPLEAFNINGFASKKFISATNDNVKIIYISTDAVFSSNLHMAKEIDVPFPENIYGKSKELGEFFLLNSNRNCIIIRTTIIGLNNYRDKGGFVEWILNSVKMKETINLFDDVLFTPISIWDLISEIVFLIDQDFYGSKIFHISGVEAKTKYEFAKLLIEELSLDTKYIKKGYISKYTDRAKRSNDQSLDSSLYQEKFKRKLPNFSETIKTIKKNIQL